MTRYALVGTGARAGMYIEALTTTYRNVAELVALCDLSQTRMDWYNRRLQAAGLTPRPAYHAGQFDWMIAETRPDTVIVTTIDKLLSPGCVRFGRAPICSVSPPINLSVQASLSTLMNYSL